MRFFKIFLVAFLSLLGTIGAIVGIMYLSGSFTKDIVEPESIYFEYVNGENAYNLSQNAQIRVMSDTENVTVTKIELSLGDGQEGTTTSQYISDGIIKVPRFVTLGQAFTVELCEGANSELGGQEWIVGGVSSLTAQSSSLKASRVTTKVNVDVPVQRVEVETYSNPTYTVPQTTFAAGETFYAKAKFYPQSSMYKFGQDGTNGLPFQMKTVYFDAISDGELAAAEENQTINAALQADGIKNIKAFNTLAATNNLSIKAYAFLNSSLENQYVAAAGGDVDQILSDLKHGNISTNAGHTLTVENIVISSFTVEESLLATKHLEFNKVNKIYANYGTSSISPNFGIKISNSDSSSPRLQNKIKNVGIEVFFKSGTNFVPANSSHFIMVDQYGQTIQPLDGKYYFPNVVESDVNKSFWNIVPLQPNLNFAFGLHIFQDNGTLDDKVSPVYTNAVQTWASTQVNMPQISWTSAEDINITIVDDVVSDNIESEEFNLSSILSFIPGTYSKVVYIAYSEGSEANLTEVLKTARPSTMYDHAELYVPENTLIFELSSPIIKLSPSAIKNFKVKAVVLATNHQGQLDGDTYRVIAQTDAIMVHANKTVKELSAHIQVSDSALLKNFHPGEAPEGGNQILDKLAFVMGQNTDNIFDIVFSVKAATEDALAREVEIFKQDFASGRIGISQRGIIGEQKSVVTYAEGVGAQKSATEWTYTISYFAGSATKDTELWFEYTYLHTASKSSIKQIKDVVFLATEDPLLATATFAEVDSAIVELYDGKVYDIAFAYDNDATSPIQQQTIISGEEVAGQRDGVDVLFADKVVRQYFAAGQPLADITDEEGRFLVVGKDKHGNVVPANYSYQPHQRPGTSPGEMYTYYYLTTQDFSNALTSAPSDELYFEDVEINSNIITGVNRGSIDLGTWRGDDIQNGFQTISADEANKEITISRYGTKNGTVQITGQTGLLSVVYESIDVLDPNLVSYFELAKVLKYEITSSLDVYYGILEYDEISGTLTILKTLGSEINLIISVSTDLGISYSLKLIIMPNINVQIQRVSAQGTLQESTIIDTKQHFWLYSDNDVKFVATFTFHLQEQAVIVLEKGSFIESQQSEIMFEPLFTQGVATAKETKEFVLNFGKNNLESQKVRLSSDGLAPHAYAFAQDMYFKVEPNIAFSTTGNTFTASVEVKNFTDFYEIITSSDIGRIIPGAELLLSDLTIFFAQTTGSNPQDQVYQIGSSTPLQTNIFTWNDRDKRLQCKAEMTGAYNPTGQYVAHLDVNYGSVTIGQIIVNISSAIKPNATAPDYQDRFAMYEGKQYLVLKAGETITTNDIKKLFSNVQDVTFAADGNFVNAKDSTTYTVKTDITTYTPGTGVTLTLKNIVQDAGAGAHTIASISFPVLFVPLDTNFVTYVNAPAFDGADLGISDLSSLNNYARLVEQNIYDEYKSGTTVNLFKLDGKEFGLSQQTFRAVKDGTYPYELLLEGENGQISTTRYNGVFSKDTGTLQILPSGQDIFAYFVVYSDTAQTKIIALYRIKIVANASINTYYPYLASPADVTDPIMAEYIYESRGQETTINLLEAHSQSVPAAGFKRVELDVFDETLGAYVETTQEYQTVFSLYKVGSLMAEGNLGTISNTHGIKLENNVLKIFNPSSGAREMDIVLKVDIMQGAINMGSTFYTIRLGSTQKDLYSLKQGEMDYTTTNFYGSKDTPYDYSDVVLYKTVGNISSPATDITLGVHYYIPDYEPVTDYIVETDKKLALTDKAISAKHVVFEYYTIYGVIHTVNLTFSSDYYYEIKDNADIALNPDTYMYEVMADTTLNIADTFTISNSDGPLDLTNVDFKYYDGDVLYTGNEITFTQISEEKQTHNLKIVALLSLIPEFGVNEDFEFEITLDVVRSISSPHAHTPMQIGDASGIVYNSSYKTNPYIVTNLLNTDPLTDGSFLFNALSAEVLTEYTLTVSISTNAQGFIGLDEAGLGTKQFSYTEFSSMADNFALYFLKSPGQTALNASLTFTLNRDYGTGLESRVVALANITLVSDVIVTFVYPQSSLDTNFKEEHIFLDSKYFKDSDDKKDFDFAGETAKTYFGDSRIIIKNRDGSEADLSRVNIVASSEHGDILFDGASSVTKDFGAKFQVAWNTLSQTSTVLSRECYFDVLVDGVSRGKYVVVFTNEINNIFAISSANNLYGSLGTNSASEPETFYVDKNATEILFSHNSALLTFKTRAQTAQTKLIAYVVNASGTKLEAGRITIAAAASNYNWLLKNDTCQIKEDLSNLIIQKETDNKTDYTFSQDLTSPTNVYYSLFSMTAPATLTYRLALSYLGQPMDAEKYQTLLTVNGAQAVASFKLTREKAVSASVEFKIDGQALVTKYYYNTIYDFVATKAYSTALGEVNKDQVTNITAPHELSQDKVTNLANSVFGISGLTSQFTETYFDQHNVNYFAQIVLITNAAFESNPVASNVRYLPSDKLAFVQKYFPNVQAVNSSENHLCASISPKVGEINKKVYDFNFMANGAENAGNYVYVLISYGASDDAVGEIKDSNIENFAFALIKLRISPNQGSIVLYNPDLQQNGPSQDDHYKITYTDGKFDDIVLGKYGDTSQDKNLIYIYGSGTTNLITSSESSEYFATLTLHGDIANYVGLERTGTTQYLVQLENKVALYGDKFGYIRIVDMYGYEKLYYLHLVASSADKALSLVKSDEAFGTFENKIPGSQNAFYSGTQMTLIDPSKTVNLGDMGAVRVNNLEFLTQSVKNPANAFGIESYQITFKIPELSYTQDNPIFTAGDSEPQKYFVIPSIKEASKEVTLQIIVTITHNGIQEVVTLETSLTIKKRFILTDTTSSLSSVQAGIKFDVSNFLTVKDEANIDTNLGGATLDAYQLTLKVSADAVYADKILNISAIHKEDDTLNKVAAITIGKDYNNRELQSSNNKYYYILALHPNLQGINFSDYRFTVSSTEIAPLSTQIVDIVADQIINLTTSNIGAGKTVYVQINNETSKYAVPFSLNANGVQSVSLAQIVETNRLVKQISHEQVATADLPRIESYGFQNVSVDKTKAIYGIGLSSTPVSAEDMQTIKNFKLYDDSLVLKITQLENPIDLTQLKFTVTIKSGDAVLGSRTLSPTHSFSHYRYVSVYNIIGSYANLADTYDIEITYELSSSQVKSLISYNGINAAASGANGNMTIYKISSKFTYAQIPAGANEQLDVLTADAFSGKIYTTEKSYLVQYLDQDNFEAKTLNYQITPKYYGVQEGTVARIYANQFQVDNSGSFTKYKVDFNTWASAVKLTNLAGEVLTTLNNDTLLRLAINTEGGLGSGAADLDSNGNIITNQNYKQEQYIVVEIWVPVAVDEYVLIGTISVELIHGKVYVANLATYMFIITYGDDPHTIEPTYKFTSNITDIEKLIFENPSTQLQGIINSENKSIQIAGEYRFISDCNIQIVTVVEQIYSVEYTIKNQKEYLRLQLKLNEISSTAGKTVEMQIAGRLDAASSSTERNIKLSIDRNPAAQNLEFIISCGANSLCERTSSGVYVVDIPFEEVFSSLIGEDYTYSAKVLNTADTNAELLYAKRTQSAETFTDGQTLFFALSFQDALAQENNMHYTLLAVKYDSSNTQMFETEGYFTLNISSLPVIDGVRVISPNADGTYTSNVACYSIKFIEAKDIDLSANDVLITTNLTGSTTNMFSVGKVSGTGTIYEVAINGEAVYNNFLSTDVTTTLSAYDRAQTTTVNSNHLPSVVTVDKAAFLGIYGTKIENMKIVGIVSDNAQIDLVINPSWGLEDEYITVIDVSNRIHAQALAAGQSLWQHDSSSFSKAVISLTTQTGYTEYAFDYNILAAASSATQVSEIDLTAMISSPQAGTFYNFILQDAQDTQNVLYFAAQASADAKVVLSADEVFTGAFSGSGKYKFYLQNITNVAPLSDSGTVYELYDGEDLVAITKVQYTQSGNLWVLSDTILKDVTLSARQNTTGTYEALIDAKTMTYVKTTIAGTSTYSIFYYDTAALYSIDLSTLAVGQTANIVISFNGFKNFNTTTSTAVLYLQSSDIDRDFDITTKNGVSTFKAPATTTQLVLDKNNLGETAAIDLTITAK